MADSEKLKDMTTVERTMVVTVLRHPENYNMTDWEADFISGLADKYAQWDVNMYISPKQLSIIQRIHDKQV